MSASKLQTSADGSSLPRRVRLCAGCGGREDESPRFFWYFDGIGADAIGCCSEACHAKVRPKKFGKPRITGFAGHNRGKKFIPGKGYVSGAEWLRWRSGAKPNIVLGDQSKK